jgi:hypothetical protein
MSEEIDNARRVSRVHAEAMLSKANVVGIGVGEGSTGGVTLVVMLKQKLPRIELNEEDLVPDEIEGIPVEIRVVGELRAEDQ